jgi:hypothetical protein
MRICLYTKTALPLIGGQELAVDALARAFTVAGHAVTVLAPRPDETGYRPLTTDHRQPATVSQQPTTSNQQLATGHWQPATGNRPSATDNRSRGIPYTVVRHPRFISMRRCLGWYQRWLLGLHRRWPFDVVHCHGVHPPGSIAVACRGLLDRPVVITSHGEEFPAAPTSFAKPAVRRQVVEALAGADALISISSYTRQGYRQLAPAAARIADIPNGTDCDALADAADRPEGLNPAVRPRRYVLFLGRLHRRKGADVLVDAYTRVAAQMPIDLVIAGDGPERAPLERQAAELGVGDRVHFTGMAVGRLKTFLLQNALCAVVPSRSWEAAPLVVLEAFAAGTPVLASALPGLADLVHPERTGFLIPPESADALAATLVAALASPAQLVALGAEARAVARQHDWRVIAQRHLALYEALQETGSHAQRRGDAETRRRGERDD